MTADQATELVRALVAAFPQGERISPETIAIYGAQLSRYDYQETREAISRVCATARFFPTIAEIIDQIVMQRMDVLPDATAAWELVLGWSTALRNWRIENKRAEDKLPTEEYEAWVQSGSPDLVPRPPRLPYEVMRALEYIGGLSEIRYSENLPVLRAQFRDAYKTILTKTEQKIRLDGIAANELIELPETT